ncbi:hypothetical protein [Rhodovulum sp. MB263]|uniref:hypothetical protein n=1 Tax=Rhodovulum sp. (strain MB263) TaxID=308754 RepID=UPI0012DB3317|nr:hypothetical protein [Rhodovulum sp. MB263]
MVRAIPRATDLPFVRLTTEQVSSPANPPVMSGCGEAGRGAMAAADDAMLDPLCGRGMW